MTPPGLVLRAEAGPSDGAGHVARGFALGQVWRDQGGPVTLVADEIPDLWRRRAEAEDMAVVGAAEATGAAQGQPAWAVLDGYRFGPYEQVRWRAEAGHLLVVDDHGAAGTWDADLVLDQNLGASLDDYPQLTAPALLGPRYALLRREFRVGAGEAGEPQGRPSSGPEAVDRVALLAGGRPSASVAALFDEVGARLAAAGFEPVVVQGSTSVARALAGVGLAVAAAGGTAWELCALGIPMVLVPVAPNQQPVAQRLGAAGAARTAEGLEAGAAAAAAVALARDPDGRAALAARARALVDGHGAVRVATRLRSELVHVRAATEQDARVTWEWANDPGTRAQSFSTRPIGWEEHLAWFTARRSDPSHAFYLGEDADGLIGLVRFSPDQPDPGGPGGLPGRSGVEVGVVVAPARRGQHLAAPLIDAGVRGLARERGPIAVTARIKVDNSGSQRAFRAADFDLAQHQSGRSAGWLQYTRARHGS